MTINDLVRMQHLAAHRIEGALGGMARIGLNNIMYACTAEMVALVAATHDWANGRLHTGEAITNLVDAYTALVSALERQQ